MQLSYQSNLNNDSISAQNMSFKVNEVINPKAPLAKPIETVQKSIEGSVDTLLNKVDSEKEKKSNKKAIAVGSSVLVLSALVVLLNPKYSSKLMTKLKTLQNEAGNKIEQSKDNYLKSNFHKMTSKILGFGIRGLQFSNNFNSAKDIYFKWLCTEKKTFDSVKSNMAKSVLKKTDSGFRKVMSTPHKKITSWFDSISKKTVQNKYKKAANKMNSLDRLIAEYKSKLPTEKHAEFDAKIAEITKCREYFSNENIAGRFKEQENLMCNLERDFLKKYRSYKNGFTNKWENKTEHINNNLTFWAEEILQPTRNKVEKQGIESVEKLVGNGKDKKGLYNELFETLSPYLSSEEKTVFEKTLNKASKKLNKANYSECIQYFDKKRDLVLGSAPTDILTAVTGLGLSGAAIATADNKEQRISRTLTGAFPVVAGLGASLAFTAMLFSGIQGMLMGTATSIGLSKLGSLTDHYVLGNKKDSTETINSKKAKTKEAINA